MPTIPSTSIVTAAMVTDWASRYGRTSAQATSDLLMIEQGDMLMPADLPVATYSALINSYRANLDRKSTSSWKTILAASLGAVMITAGFFNSIVTKSNKVGSNGRAMTQQIYATSSIDWTAPATNLTPTSSIMAVTGATTTNSNTPQRCSVSLPAGFIAGYGTSTSFYCYPSGTDQVTITWFSFSTTTLPSDPPAKVFGVELTDYTP